MTTFKIDDRVAVRHGEDKLDTSLGYIQGIDMYQVLVRMDGSSTLVRSAVMDDLVPEAAYLASQPKPAEPSQIQKHLAVVTADPMTQWDAKQGYVPHLQVCLEEERKKAAPRWSAGLTFDMLVSLEEADLRAQDEVFRRIAHSVVRASPFFLQDDNPGFNIQTLPRTHVPDGRYRFGEAIIAKDPDLKPLGDIAHMHLLRSHLAELGNRDPAKLVDEDPTFVWELVYERRKYQRLYRTWESADAAHQNKAYLEWAAFRANVGDTWEREQAKSEDRDPRRKSYQLKYWEVCLRKALDALNPFASSFPRPGTLAAQITLWNKTRAACHSRCLEFQGLLDDELRLGDPVYREDITTEHRHGLRELERKAKRDGRFSGAHFEYLRYRVDYAQLQPPTDAFPDEPKLSLSSPCEVPRRDGKHEVYMGSQGARVCRACGATAKG